jgi:hypothetical protein
VTASRVHSLVEAEWPLVIRPLFAPKKRTHFKTRKVCKQQKYDHCSIRGPKSRTTVLMRAYTNSLDWNLGVNITRQQIVHVLLEWNKRLK